MALIRSYKVYGLELAPYVTEWGQVEEVKDVLLAQAQLFTAQHTLTLANADGRFSPKITSSLFYGRNYELAPVTLAVGGTVLYQGFIRSIEPDHATRTVKIITHNAFTVPANTAIVYTASNANPATVIQAILTQVGLGAYLDVASFNAAAGGFAAAGATISVTYAAGGNVTALAAIQAISSLCSLSCFTHAGLIRLQAFQPYQGSLSGIKYQITGTQVYDFSGLADAYSNLSNSVTILYGSSSSLTLTNAASVLSNGINTNTQFSAQTGSPIAVPNLVSATYFANQFLARAATLRQQGSFVGGQELQQTAIGDRITVSAPNWGSSPIAFEVIETHLTIATNATEIVCATI